MTRRVYYLDAKGKRIRQEALMNMRAARRAIDPDLLQTAREALAQFIENSQQAQRPAPESRSEPIDMKKNLSTVMQYLEIKQGDKHLRNRIQTLLSEI